MFKNGWYLSSAFLYNEKGLDHPANGLTLPAFRTSPRSLMPTKWNIIVTTSREFTPIFSGRMNAVYAPEEDAVIPPASGKWLAQLP